jgi:membrane protease YdiL (CAAX protease family)
VAEPADEAPREFPVAGLPSDGPADQDETPAGPFPPPTPPREEQAESAVRGNLAWGVAAFVFGYGGYYLVGLLVSGALPGHAPGFDPARPPSLSPLLLLAFVPNIMLGLIPAVFSWWKGRGLRSDFGIVPTRRDVKVGLACGISALVASSALGLVLIRVSGAPPDERISQLTQGPKSIWLLLFALFAFIGAPLTEELLVRGALWGALEHYRIPRGSILMLTALIFALIHLDLWRLPILFVGGLALGYARMRTGRIGASMVAHATNNFLPALVLFAAAR